MEEWPVTQPQSRAPSLSAVNEVTLGRQKASLDGKLYLNLCLSSRLVRQPKATVSPFDTNEVTRGDWGQRMPFSMDRRTY